jgi:hypothetical protein
MKTKTQSLPGQTCRFIAGVTYHDCDTGYGLGYVPQQLRHTCDSTNQKPNRASHVMILSDDLVK